MSGWNQMSSRKKIEFLVRNVLQWKYFPEWDIKHTARWALEGEVTWPYAFWNGQRDGICVFYAPDEHARSFNPLESMDDAWKIIEWSNHLSGSLRWEFDAVLEINLRDAWKTDNPSYEPRLKLDFMAKLTPEMLCSTAWNIQFSMKKRAEDKMNEGEQI